MDQIKEYFKNINFNWKALFKTAGILFLVGVISIAFLYSLVRFNAFGNIPSDQDLRNIDNPLGSTLYASDNKMIGKFYVENRGDLQTSDLTENYKNALIATEDVRFYKHGGVDKRSLLRVLVKSILLQKDNSGGGSTLTQQLAKNLYPRKRFKMISIVMNKFREMVIAQKLEKIYSKDEILLLYSNTVSFGERAFGLHTAAQRFFDKEPIDLNLVESATLVGILKAPSYYSPKRNPERALSRRNIVLAQMNKYGLLTDEVYDEAKEEPLELKYKSLTETFGFARYFQQFVRKEFNQWAEENPKEDGSIYNVNTDGLEIHTSLDYEMQLAAEQNMEEHMKALQAIFDKSWKGSTTLYGNKGQYAKEALRSTDIYKRLKKEGNNETEILEMVSLKEPKEVWAWDGRKEIEMSTMDSVKHYLSMLHNGIFALDSKEGLIKVWVGGNDFGAFQWDNVTSPRQVGSTFKPIVYLTAMQKGTHPCDYFPNELRSYSSYKDWTPRNADKKYGGYLSVTEALTHSVNTVSVQMIFSAGINNVINQAKEMGVTTKLPEVPSIVLGTADISLFDMVKVYAYLSNGGRKLEPKSIVKIKDREGNLLYQSDAGIKQDRPLPDSTFLALNSMMSRVVSQGTGRRLYSQYDVPFEVMGKTGTTQNQSDGWFISYTGDLVIGAWVGAHDRRIHFRNLGTGSGGRSALPLVGGIWEHAANNGYRPSHEITMEMDYCLDSIGVEEYAMLGTEYNEHRFDQIIQNRNPRNAKDIILGTGHIPNPGDVILAPNPGENRAPRRRGSQRSNQEKEQRKRKIENFKKKVERALRKIGN